jgi:hypothetical protein
MARMENLGAGPSRFVVRHAAGGLWAQSRQQQLAEKLIRLHVVAVSDSAKDQATKLEVRDGVLALLGPLWMRQPMRMTRRKSSKG